MSVCNIEIQVQERIIIASLQTIAIEQNSELVFQCGYPSLKRVW